MLEAMETCVGNIRGLKSSWTSGEIQRLRNLASLGAGPVAEELGRSIQSVRAAANRHRISLRPEGERRGTVLGQPRGVSLKAARTAEASLQAIEDVRAAIANGLVDPGDLERAVRRRRRLLLGEPLCPGCGRNPIERETGLCDDCHWRGMADAHRLGVASAGQREYERERKRAQRSRKESA